MRRKNRKWVATAVVLYLLVMWSAYRWGIAQRPAEGSIFHQIEHKASLRQLELHAQEKADREAAILEQAREARFATSAPAYVAARYDATHVVFMVVEETESRFAPTQHSASSASRIAASEKPAAPLAGLQELWEPDSQELHFFPEIVQKTQPGEQWMLNLSPDSTIPVVIDRTVIAPTGCSLALGFLAAVPPDQQPTFAASSQEYFSVRRTPVEPTEVPVDARTGPLPDWKPSAATRAQMVQQLTDKMKQEVGKIDARLTANAGSPGTAAADAVPARPRLKEWLHADGGLLRGDGTLDYDMRAFRLTPDGAPRVFVRARWKLADSPVFLMIAWFKNGAAAAAPPNIASKREPAKRELKGELNSELKSASLTIESPTIESPQPEAPPDLLFVDSSWSSAMREAEPTGTLGDRLDFESILNEFDVDHDGWAELLIHSDQGSSTTISLYLYTDLGLVPVKAPFRRDTQPPESCIGQ